MNQAVLVLEVEDSGIGMLAEDLERIFETFVQVDNSAAVKSGAQDLDL